ncbi:MAG: acyl carrier protein [Alphaproteobacteria bacterium]|nr:acyl carrier protein [Alphaproteobacteria bacterium]
MTPSEIHAGLTEIFRETFDNPNLILAPEMTARDIEGWDSLKMVIIILAVEERFDIQLRTREMDVLRCVGDFASLIEQKRSP